MRRKIWLVLAVILLGAGVFQIFMARGVGAVSAPDIAQAPVQGSVEKVVTVPPSAVPAIAVETPEDVSPELKQLREQMSKERGIQQQIKLHNLELERTRIQLEQEKALAEMNQLRKSNLGVIRDPNGNGTIALPDMKVVFLSESEKAHQAILTINGANFTVQEGDRPMENLLVKSISRNGVLLLVNGEKEILLTPNLME